MSNQSGVQAAVRAATSTTGTYEEDWLALFDADGIGAGTFDERLLSWINFKLTASHTNINEAMQAFADNQGFDNWSSMDTMVL